MAAALKLVHEGLADFDGELPSFVLELDDAKRLVQPRARRPWSPPIATFYWRW
jgi:hypothetical protein